jgi:hypothetical protein
MLMTRRFSVLVLLLGLSPIILAARPASPSGPIVTAETPHLTVMAIASMGQVALGQRVSFTFNVTPRRNIHIYAPGKHTYQVVKIALDAQPWLRVHPTTYPPSEIYYFKPLDERVAVYQKPFQLVQDVTVLSTPAARKSLAGRDAVTITGRIEYQACDDRICYRPQSVPVSWQLAVKANT